MTNHFDDKMHVLVFTGDIKFFPFEGRNATQKINAEFRINIPDWMLKLSTLISTPLQSTSELELGIY